MDQTRFDHLVRALGASGTRRQAMRAALAVVGVGAIAQRNAAAQRPDPRRTICRRAGIGCSRAEQCCTRYCETRREVDRARRNRCACPDGEILCSGVCTDTETSVANCGGCGDACDADVADSCVDSACSCGGGAACRTGETCISGACVCGAGPGCGDLGACVSGACACGSNPACNPDKASICDDGVCQCGTNAACTGATYCNDGTCDDLTCANTHPDRELYGSGMCVVDFGGNVHQLCGNTNYSGSNAGPTGCYANSDCPASTSERTYLCMYGLQFGTTSFQTAATFAGTYQYVTAGQGACRFYTAADLCPA